MPTHEVKNQVPPLAGYNLYAADRVLTEAVAREGAAWIADRANRLGEILGAEEAIGWGFDANNYPPVLHTHDTQGHRIDQVRFHPAWHALMRLSVEYGVHNLPWASPQPGAHVARATLMYLVGQNEAGHSCPISMTYAAVPSLAAPAGPGRDLGAAYRQHDVRPSLSATRRKAGRADRHGHDREARWLRRSRQYHPGRGGRRRRTRGRVSHHGPQVVLLRARCATRSWFWPRHRRTVVLPVATLDARRPAEPLLRATVEEQVGQSFQRLERGRVRQCLRHADWRRRTRRANDRRDGQSHAARLHAGRRRHDAAGRRPGHLPHASSIGLWPLARRSAADAERANGSVPGVRSRHDPRPAAGPGL